MKILIVVLVLCFAQCQSRISRTKAPTTATDQFLEPNYPPNVPTRQQIYPYDQETANHHYSDAVPIYRQFTTILDKLIHRIKKMLSVIVSKLQLLRHRLDKYGWTNISALIDNLIQFLSPRPDQPNLKPRQPDLRPDLRPDDPYLMPY